LSIRVNLLGLREAKLLRRTEAVKENFTSSVSTKTFTNGQVFTDPML